MVRTDANARQKHPAEQPNPGRASELSRARNASAHALWLTPFVAATAVGVAHTLDLDGGSGIELARAFNRFFLGRFNRAGAVGIRLAHGVIALWALFDEKFAHGDEPA